MMRPLTIDIGTPDRLGAHWDGHGVNFAVYSKHASRLDVCLFDPAGSTELARIPLPSRTGDVWHGFVPNATPGLVYGYRAHGDYAPADGHRFNPHKLLVDPYARELVGEMRWNDAVYGYARGTGPECSTTPDTHDSAPYVPKSRVTRPLQQVDARPPRPATPWCDTVIYELHVRGFSMLHPDVPAVLRGKLAALATPPLIDYLHALGITAVELMPTTAFIDEPGLVERGLRNYWGYNPISLFATHRDYLLHDDVGEFVRTIDALHAAGIEVILDIVLGHTAELGASGPTLGLRGLDNATYYRTMPGQPACYADYTGCGNTLDLSVPAVVELVHAALRYWACDIGVDGFRFDLGATMMRDRDGQFCKDALLARTIADDADLSALKLIVEPWDLGTPGNFAGAFPAPFVEWNDRYRQDIARFWRAEPGARRECATRFAGSSDLFETSGRPPQTGINYVASHDGLPLADQTASAEHSGAPLSHVHDVGTRDRRRQRASRLATLLLSHGTPMLLAGDELSRSQQGVDNAYCYDSPLSWIDWSARDDPARNLVPVVRAATRLRRAGTLLRQTRFFDGRAIAGADTYRDITWLSPDGHTMTGPDWDATHEPALAILLVDPARTTPGGPERLYLALNAGPTARTFKIPDCPGHRDGAWLMWLDSSADSQPTAVLHAGHTAIELDSGGMLALIPADTHSLGVSAALAARAHQAGILTEYTDLVGARIQAPAASLARLATALEMRGNTRASTGAPVAPTVPTCWLPEALRSSGRRWVLSVQTYALRSKETWGIGDYDALAQVAQAAAHVGAAGVLSSPVHAPRLTCPDQASPYSPDDRLMLNPLLISVPRAAGRTPPPGYLRFLDRDDVRAELMRLERADTIDSAAVASLKLRALSYLHEAFRERESGPARSPEGDAYRRFCDASGAALYEYAVFQVLSETFSREAGGHMPWTAWPPQYHRPDSPAVRQFALKHAVRVDFFMYLQWIARGQWHDAAQRIRAAGMPIGLAADLAVGADLDSTEGWRWSDLLVHGVGLGAPPDAFSPGGQCWGIAPWHPGKLAAVGYAPFNMLLSAAMHDAGAVRIDHAVGLMRQYWIPYRRSARDGAYVRFPFDSLMRCVANASRSHRCMVICEDLGLVPPTLRERLEQACTFGFRVAWFEREPDGSFKDGSDYQPLTVAMTSTHDLPTTAGFFLATDIARRDALHLYASPEQRERAKAERCDTLAALRARLARYGPTDDPAAFTDALHRFLTDSASRLVVAQLDDILGVTEQANLPEWGDKPPNWRRRLTICVETLASNRRFSDARKIFRNRAP
ncbi:glycogen debranching protein GlgX [Burkholderia cepacia]|uniref:glycogen debranching protein GlgX n=1 Tax=Burkholderia cepacia TaxID=292 RepID=UPI001906C407|nr:glycogen debranching protein GlgX [Burkholderia cepacia]MBJ9752203.1 glycogen debranching protein GlgX [Burkholderia cepacia]